MEEVEEALYFETADQLNELDRFDSNLINTKYKECDYNLIWLIKRRQEIFPDELKDITSLYVDKYNPDHDDEATLQDKFKEYQTETPLDPATTFQEWKADIYEVHRFYRWQYHQFEQLMGESGVSEKLRKDTKWSTSPSSFDWFINQDKNDSEIFEFALNHRIIHHSVKQETFNSIDYNQAYYIYYTIMVQENEQWDLASIEYDKWPRSGNFFLTWQYHAFNLLVGLEEMAMTDAEREEFINKDSQAAVQYSLIFAQQKSMTWNGAFQPKLVWLALRRKHLISEPQFEDLSIEKWEQSNNYNKLPFFNWQLKQWTRLEVFMTHYKFNTANDISKINNTEEIFQWCKEHHITTTTTWEEFKRGSDYDQQAIYIASQLMGKSDLDISSISYNNWDTSSPFQQWQWQSFQELLARIETESVQSKMAAKKVLDVIRTVQRNSRNLWDLQHPLKL